MSEALGTCKHLPLPTELGHQVGDVKSQVWNDPWGVKGAQKAADLSAIRIISVFIPLHIACSRNSQESL